MSNGFNIRHQAENQHRTRRTARTRAIGVAVLVSLCGVATGGNAQVTYFDKPPSAAELRRALTGARGIPPPSRPAAGPTTDLPAGVRTRGIVWAADGTAPGNQPRPDAGSLSAAAPVTAPITNDNQRPSAYAQAYADTRVGPAAGMPINFASGSSQIDPSSTGFIRTVAEMLMSDPALRLVIEGHTNSTGRYERNMVLSWERAMGVFRMLVEQFGIDPARLQLVGKGPTEPMPGTTAQDGTNRRVQFRLQG